jgi:L-ascorbate metabolism protein UlaG (beta-lactamase superfamily)
MTTSELIAHNKLVLILCDLREFSHDHYSIFDINTLENLNSVANFIDKKRSNIYNAAQRKVV